MTTHIRIRMHTLIALFATLAVVCVSSFAPTYPIFTSTILRSNTRLYSDNSGGTKGKNGKTKFGQKTDAEISRFLVDFRTADGAVVDPYRMLNLSRDATPQEIKQSYRRLSRKLHPDMVAQRDVLPGRW